MVAQEWASVVHNGSNHDGRCSVMEALGRGGRPCHPILSIPRVNTMETPPYARTPRWAPPNETVFAPLPSGRSVPRSSTTVGATTTSVAAVALVTVLCLLYLLR